jgi:DNA polymerase III subunit beta
MKLTTEPAALAAAVKFAARALTARAAYPILGGLKITASPGSVEVAAFDHETSARARINAEVGEPGTVLAPGRLLADITARLPRQPAELAAGDDGTLTLAAGSTRYTLRLLPVDEYPALPELADPAGQVDAGEFAAAVRQVVVAASRDDTLPALCTVQATFTGDVITMVTVPRR